MRDILISLLLVGSVGAGASETAGMTNFMQGENPLGAIVRSITASEATTGPSSVSAMYVAQTDGTGVRARAECSPDALDSGAAIAEGASVQVVRVGAAECPGWALVSAGGTEAWVRMTYLNAANPVKPNANVARTSSGAGSGHGRGNVVTATSNTLPAASSNAALKASTSSKGSSGGALNVPTALPSLGIDTGIGAGLGWGQGIGGGQDHLSALPAPGNSGGSPANANAATPVGNGQGWGQGVGGGQDHQSSGLAAPGNSGGSSASDKPK
jgi:hypothetical protein